VRSVTVRLSDGEYVLLQARAVAEGVSVTRLAKSLLVVNGGVSSVPDGGSEPSPCLRFERHEPGLRCPLCGAS